MGLNDYLKILAVKDGSDIYLSTGAPPCAKFHGVLRPWENEQLKPGKIKEIANGVMNGDQRKEFETALEMNLAISKPGVGRFRVNIFKLYADWTTKGIRPYSATLRSISPSSSQFSSPKKSRSHISMPTRW